MIVTDANAFTRAVHNRMPVFLDRPDLEPWLSGAAGPELLRPTAEDRLRDPLPAAGTVRRSPGKAIWSPSRGQ
jgi:putative SOS response-associated peptidase YedK